MTTTNPARRVRQIRNINRRLCYLLTIYLVCGIERGLYDKAFGIYMIAVCALCALAADVICRRSPRAVAEIVETLTRGKKASKQEKGTLL